ncbi:Origin recognition complex subunit 3 [Mycoemilia scoparia]|uniref:Origin recognition complex subunit 3 n=1 Tax=Mycoemilia scoparia TaxID=417184 RepID=A0A9W8A3K1_9FUNG|nr:Origin recognition complex subunit 3 [Mycoemilia scoparia]
MRDLNDPFDSTSEYVFVVKPKLDQPSLTIDGVGHSDYDGFRPLLSGKENLRMLKWRKKLFNQVWAGIESDVEYFVAYSNATSYGTLSQTLSNGALSKISVEKFNIHRSNELINGIISKVIVPCSGGFSLGYESYRHLMDQFLLYNFSVKSFLSHLKYAIMHHFYANPLSILHMLYDGNKRSLIHPKELKLSQDHIELIRMLPSVRRYIEDTYKDDKEAMKLAIVDDKYFVEVIIQRMMESLTEYREKYRAGLKIIQCLQDLMEPSQRKAIRTLHLYGLNDDFEQCVYWETVANTIKRLNRKKMVGFMEAVVNETRSLLMGFGPLDERIKKLKKISDALALASDPEQSSYKDALKQALGDTTGTESPSNTPSLRVRTRRAMSVNPFLLSNEEKNPEVISLLEVGSTVILDILRNLLRCYTEAPLYEAFYYQSQKLLSMTFNAQPRASVQVALHHPNYYLGCECCAPDTKAIKQEEPLKFGSKIFGDSGGANEDGAVLPTNPDTAIAYRLHQECGRMVNLYDWYMAFASIVERESKVKDEKSLDPQYQKQIQ